MCACARSPQPAPPSGTRSDPARKQSPFEGSFRQRRSAALRLVAEQPQPVAELDDEAAIHALERDGLVVVENGVVALPA